MNSDRNFVLIFVKMPGCPGCENLKKIFDACYLKMKEILPNLPLVTITIEGGSFDNSKYPTGLIGYLNTVPKVFLIRKSLWDSAMEGVSQDRIANSESSSSQKNFPVKFNKVDMSSTSDVFIFNHVNNKGKCSPDMKERQFRYTQNPEGFKEWIKDILKPNEANVGVVKTLPYGEAKKIPKVVGYKPEQVPEKQVPEKQVPEKQVPEKKEVSKKEDSTTVRSHKTEARVYRVAPVSSDDKKTTVIEETKTIKIIPRRISKNPRI